MRALLLSNSTSPGHPYLAHARDWIAEAVGDARRVAFVPYAAVTFSYDEYVRRVREGLDGLGLEINGVHAADDPARAVAEAEAVFVGGGNTFHLLREMYRLGLIAVIRATAGGGAPYVGWSAGANVAGPTIRTTNDMPIVEPPSFDALGLVGFQINPHYTDAPGHQGETRAQRLAEFVAADPDVPVVGLPEGTALRLVGADVSLLGAERAVLFDRHSAGGRPVGRDEISLLR